MFALPVTLLQSLQYRASNTIRLTDPLHAIEPPLASKLQIQHEDDVPLSGSTPVSKSCALCGNSFASLAEQRSHVRSDRHAYNLKQKLRGRPVVDDATFENLLEELDESLSGSDRGSEGDEDDSRLSNGTLAALLRRQAKVHVEALPEDGMEEGKPKIHGSPLLLFSSPLIPSNTALAMYKALFTAEDLAVPDLTTVLRGKQLPPLPSANSSSSRAPPLPPNSPTVFICLIGGGHFAAALMACTFLATRSATGHAALQPMVLAHKTFHRYTTRRKQGGSQAANDAAKGAAHSAGAGIRRYNEAALEAEIRALLAEWAVGIEAASLWFVRATGAANRKVLFGGDGGMKASDPRVRGVPFATRRATGKEVRRVWDELVRARVVELAAEKPQQKEGKKPIVPQKPEVAKTEGEMEEQEQLLHTSQIQALIRRSKAPALLTYLTSNKLSPDYIFQPSTAPAHHHSPSALHFAASTNSPAVVTALLTKAGADPTLTNAESRTAFDLAANRATRDAFRVARSLIGEQRWDWEKAHVPAAMTKAEADEKAETQKKEEVQQEEERRKAELERLRAESVPASEKPKNLKVIDADLSAEEKREREGRGLTPEVRMKLERERRARAAEERMRRMAGGR